jgi:hypothetical protein
MVSRLLLVADTVVGVPAKLWYTVLVGLCILLIVMYVKYRRSMKP